MLKIEDDKFVTQYIYRCREEKREFVLGFIADFKGQGVTKKYKKDDPYHKHKGFVHSYKASVDGITWSDDWHTMSGAIRELLRHHGKDELLGTYHIIPCPQTFKKRWKKLDYSKKLKKPKKRRK